VKINHTNFCSMVCVPLMFIFLHFKNKPHWGIASICFFVELFHLVCPYPHPRKHIHSLYVTYKNTVCLRGGPLHFPSLKSILLISPLIPCKININVTHARSITKLWPARHHGRLKLYILQVKGTVSRDFFTLVFSSNNFP
jgi:hypothetical protein